MRVRSLLLAAAAANVAVISGAAPAEAKTRHTGGARHAGVSNQQLMKEIEALKAQVAELREQTQIQASAQSTTQAQVDATQQQVQAVQVTSSQQQAELSTLPTTIKTQVADSTKVAIEKEHHNDKFYFKGITITPGGFLELAGIYRSRFQGDDISSSFTIPFPGQSHPSHVAEGRFTARQSRVSFLAQGKPNAHVNLAMYGEFDFQGAAQTSNSNQSNSYVPRIRNLYGTIDWDQGTYGLHVLAGQNWSLLTMQGKGMSPRSEVTPPQIDAQYIPGFAWARQPGVRLTADFMDHKLWLGVAAENAQTTFGGTGVPAGYVSVVNGQGLSGVSVTCPGGAAAGTTVTCTATSTTQAAPPGSFQVFYNGVGSSLSLSNIPDFIGKVAYEDSINGHTLHIEGFGMYRTFNTHLDGTSSNQSTHSFGFGGSIAVGLVPKILDVQFSGLGGKGIGRYGSAGLPDVTSDKAGNLHPLKEFMLLAGATLHATPKLDLYAFAGEEQERQQLYDGGTSGLGVPTADNSGCFVEAPTNTTTYGCAGNTRRIRQLTLGAWDKIYMGSFGRAQVGIQYSYTQRQLFAGSGSTKISSTVSLPAFAGMPQTDNNMVFVSFRYYPF